MFAHQLMIYCIERCLQGLTGRIRFEESSSTIRCLLLSNSHVYFIQLVISSTKSCALNLNSYLHYLVFLRWVYQITLDFQHVILIIASNITDVKLTDL